MLSTEAFDVRWSLPIDNPFDVLETVGGDSPLVDESRLGVLTSWAKQRAVSKGVEGLLLGSVEPHPHQPKSCGESRQTRSSGTCWRMSRSR